LYDLYKLVVISVSKAVASLLVPLTVPFLFAG
jgi:hypothetical protein